jgi:hypothetical protein
MESIKETVASIMQGLGSKKTAQGDIDPQAWLKKVLTKREIRHIKVKYFRKGILGLSVDSSSWLYSYTLKKPSLLNKLRAQSSAIKDIQLRIGDV